MRKQNPAVITAQACQRVVDACRTHYQWQLLDREEFAYRVFEQLAADATTDLRRVVIHIYTEALYYACSGCEGRQRQERGYTELFRFLYRCVERCYPEVCADAAQRAIEKIYRTIGHCRRPNAFLAFALQKLRDARRVELRLLRTGDFSLDELSDEDGEPIGDRIPAAQNTDPAESALKSELRERVAQCAQEFLQRHPRATEQLAALWMRYVDGLDDVTISRKLGKSVGSIQVLRSRAAAKLRNDPSWQILGSELALNVTNSARIS
jgi:RNA polymerase sigma factor (sigma-70 family)